MELCKPRVETMGSRPGRREPPPPPPESGSPWQFRVPKNCRLSYTLARPLLGNAAEITVKFGGGELFLPLQKVYTLSIKNRSDFSFTFRDPRNIGLAFFSTKEQAPLKGCRNTHSLGEPASRNVTRGENTKAQHFDILEDFPFF